MMNKLFRGSLALAVGLTLMGGSSVYANAASWHRGTPAALRGKYKSRPKGVHKNYVRLYIRKYSAPFYGFQNGLGSSMQGIAMYASYEKLSPHLYKINGMDKSNTVNQTMKVYKKGAKIKFTFFRSFKGQAWLYRY